VPIRFPGLASLVTVVPPVTTGAAVRRHLQPGAVTRRTGTDGLRRILGGSCPGKNRTQVLVLGVETSISHGSTAARTHPSFLVRGPEQLLQTILPHSTACEYDFRGGPLRPAGARRGPTSTLPMSDQPAQRKGVEDF